jgi:hypothetical protein
MNVACMKLGISLISDTHRTQLRRVYTNISILALIVELNTSAKLSKLSIQPIKQTEHCYRLWFIHLF